MHIRFPLELLHFDECVTQDRQPLTDAAGFREDLAVLTEIARAFDVTM